MCAGTILLSVQLAGAEELRDPPDYYLDTLFAVSLAETLGAACAEVEINVTGIGVHIAGVNTLLSKDGFDPAATYDQMTDPSPQLAERNTAFLARHPGLEGAGPAAVCAAARAEMAEETLIGRMLLPVEGD